MLIINYINNVNYSLLYHIVKNNKKYTYILQLLFIRDFPILELSLSGLKRRINVLIAKILLKGYLFMMIQRNQERIIIELI